MSVGASSRNGILEIDALPIDGAGEVVMEEECEEDEDDNVSLECGNFGSSAEFIEKIDEVRVGMTEYPPALMLLLTLADEGEDDDATAV